MIAEIDSRDFRICKERAEAIYNQAKAVFEQIKALYEKNNLSNSIDYLLKPIHEERLLQTILRFEGLSKNYIQDFKAESWMVEVLQQLTVAQESSLSTAKKYRTRFLIFSGEKLLTLQVSDIAYFYSENKLTFAVTHKKREYLIGLALDRLYEQLDPDRFFRTVRLLSVLMLFSVLNPTS